MYLYDIKYLNIFLSNVYEKTYRAVFHLVLTYYIRVLFIMKVVLILICIF